MAKNPSEDFSPKEANPNIRAGKPTNGDKIPLKFDLVEQMEFLYVRIVKARDLKGACGGLNTCDPYVEVKLGNHVATTLFLEKCSYPEWNQVFAFEKGRIQDLMIEILMKDRYLAPPENFVGRLKFSIVEDVVKRVPPEGPVTPQWYRLEDKDGSKLKKGDLMVSFWMGTQADEFYPYAWHSDTAAVSYGVIAHTRSKLYISPTFWYLRVNVIQAQDLLLREKPENSEIFVQASLGYLRMRTGFSKNKNANPTWNEDLIFVAEEPFKEPLKLSIEQGDLTRYVNLGWCEVPLREVTKRTEPTGVPSKWYNLNRPGITEVAPAAMKFASKLNMKISLDGGYHVFDEVTEFASDLRPSSKALWKSSIGVLELGILKATDLQAMKMGGRTDAYCVAKYGRKWVRTRTVPNSLSPKWNEQYVWDVYDPFTVITIAVFNNNHLIRRNMARKVQDTRMGRVRIRLSMLENNKIYTVSYPLIGLHPSGVRKMGEIHLAVRFSWKLTFDIFPKCLVALLPRMHYLLPLSAFQLEALRNQAVSLTSLRLKRAEPPVGSEVVEYMLDVRSEIWSKRRGWANVNRIKALLNDFFAFCKWLEDICAWKNPVTTILFHLLCFLVLFFPKPILPTTLFYICKVIIGRYWNRPRGPSNIDVKLSCADTASTDDLEEEFDLYPSTFRGEILRQRYDMLRTIGTYVIAVADKLATIGERLQCMKSWDPRVTTAYFLFCLIISAHHVLFVFNRFDFLYPHLVRLFIILWIFYMIRHPRIKTPLPPIAYYYYTRLPSKRSVIL